MGRTIALPFEPKISNERRRLAPGSTEAVCFVPSARGNSNTATVSSARLSLPSFQDRRDFRGRPEQPHHGIDQVAAQVEHLAAGEARQFEPLRRILAEQMGRQGEDFQVRRVERRLALGSRELGIGGAPLLPAQRIPPLLQILLSGGGVLCADGLFIGCIQGQFLLRCTVARR